MAYDSQVIVANTPIAASQGQVFANNDDHLKDSIAQEHGFDDADPTECKHDFAAIISFWAMR